MGIRKLKFLPNFLTILRILLAPLGVALLLQKNFSLSLVLYVSLAFTDALDGFLARRLNAHSKLGSFLDPIADKFVSVLFYTALMILGNCPPWFVGLIISVTVLQGLGLSWIEALSTRRKMKFSPLWVGKINMVLQLSWIAWLILRLALNEGRNVGYISWPESIFFVSLAIIQVGVFITYFFHYRVHLTPEIKTFFPIHAKESVL